LDNSLNITLISYSAGDGDGDGDGKKAVVVVIDTPASTNVLVALICIGIAAIY
jgi:hypothetical protein